MINTYAKIQNGIVINTVLAPSTDPQDAAFTWVDITNLTPPPSIGWDYDGSIFTAPASGPPPTPQQVYTEVVLAAIDFGQNIIVDFTVANILAGITQAGKTSAMLSYTSDLAMCLNTGSLYSAVDEINTMILDTSTTKTNLSPFVTNAILISYLHKLQTYLGLPNT